SITMYNADGWIFDKKAILNEYNIDFNSDGTFDVSFGDCGESAKNNLPIVDGWNFLMRIYEPDLESLDKYRMPTPSKVK
ncbi:lytic murein transglycosylase, partial [Vibrio sp. 10N.222.55.F8]